MIETVEGDVILFPAFFRNAKNLYRVCLKEREYIITLTYAVMNTSEREREKNITLLEKKKNQHILENRHQKKIVCDLFYMHEK